LGIDVEKPNEPSIEGELGGGGLLGFVNGEVGVEKGSGAGRLLRSGGWDGKPVWLLGVGDQGAGSQGLELLLGVLVVEISCLGCRAPWGIVRPLLNKNSDVQKGSLIGGGFGGEVGEERWSSDQGRSGNAADKVVISKGEVKGQKKKGKGLSPVLRK